MFALQLAGYRVKAMLAEPKGKRKGEDGRSWSSSPTWGQVPSCCPQSPAQPAFDSIGV